MSTAGLSSQEIADRQQIQAVWIRYFDLAAYIFKIPASKRKVLLEQVAVKSQANTFLAGIAESEKEGWENYGSMGHRPYWNASVGGRSTAMMGDCMDASKAGREVTKTGERLSVGVARYNTMGTFTRGPDKVWRVSAIQSVTDPC